VAWEFDEADLLLAPGDPVTIRRATLGSYVLITRSERSHRVRRTLLRTRRAEARRFAGCFRKCAC
jgi:hypothetical protein